MAVHLNLRQRKERVAQLKEREGCILCHCKWNTKLLYMPPKDLVYYNNQDGDFLLCVWHEKFYNEEWCDDDVAKGVVRKAILQRAFDLPFTDF